MTFAFQTLFATTIILGLNLGRIDIAFQDVADAALDFMTNETPKMRYMVTPNADQAESTIRAMLKKTIQLNQDQAYSFDKATLLKMLEEEINK